MIKLFQTRQIKLSLLNALQGLSSPSRISLSFRFNGTLSKHLADCNKACMSDVGQKFVGAIHQSV